MLTTKFTPVQLFVSPTPQEFSAVKRGLKSALSSGISLPILKKCGVGEKKSGLFCQELDPNRISALVLIGWAGGLARDLVAGDIIYAESALREGQPTVECCPVPFIQKRLGPILTVPRALVTPEEKETALASGAVAVEMEAYPMAAWAQQHAIPFYHLRVILDAWDEPLPDFGAGMEISEKIHLGPILKQISLQPHLMGDLWRLFNRVRAVDPVLANLAERMIKYLQQNRQPVL